MRKLIIKIMECATLILACFLISYYATPMTKTEIINLLLGVLIGWSCKSSGKANK